MRFLKIIALGCAVGLPVFGAVPARALGDLHVLPRPTHLAPITCRAPFSFERPLAVGAGFDPAARAEEEFLVGTPAIRYSLAKLNMLGSVLMIGAHPDDENNALLAYLSRGLKARTGYLACTRGEGGQNLLGLEQGALLGVLRTQELLAARRDDGGSQYFTRAIDFGFTTSPEETMADWGHDRTLADIVWVIRQQQPVPIRLLRARLDSLSHHFLRPYQK